MAMKKSSMSLDVDMKKEIIETLKERMIHVLTIVLFIGLWVAGILLYVHSLYSFLMIILSIIFVIVMFITYIISDTKHRIASNLLYSNDNFKEIVEQVEKEKG